MSGIQRHDGGPRLCPAEAMVVVRMRDGTVEGPRCAGAHFWGRVDGFPGRPQDIVHWRYATAVEAPEGRLAA